MPKTPIKDAMRGRIAKYKMQLTFIKVMLKGNYMTQIKLAYLIFCVIAGTRICVIGLIDLFNYCDAQFIKYIFTLYLTK